MATLSDISLHPLRSELSVPLSTAQVDLKWQQIEAAINALNGAVNDYRQSYTGLGAGELVITHNFGLVPMSVHVWQKVNDGGTYRWIPMATPAVSYLDSEATSKVRIDFSDAPGDINVIIKF